MNHHIEDSLNISHNHQHLTHNFNVPAGTTQIEINFSYSPKKHGDYGNLLTLSLFGPHGERGTGHRGQPQQQVIITDVSATPGYMPGIEPGEWQVMINTNLILPGVDVRYTLDIALRDTPVTGTAPGWQPGYTAPRGAGWYRGDLHAHTVHSDGRWGPEGLIQHARQHQLDFVTLSDHNTTSALEEIASYADDDLLVMGGFELTTFYGHALALGARELIDWRVRPGTRSIIDIFNEIDAAGHLFIIAHPACPGDPICTGCMWDYTEIMPGPARVVEIWNEHWTSGSDNPGSLALWYKWLNEGHRLAATVGTDIHGQPAHPITYGFDVVYAEELSEKAILTAIKQGHLYLSDGPSLFFEAQSDTGETAMMGDQINGANYTLSFDWSRCAANDRIRCIVDGQPTEERDAQVNGSMTWTMQGKHWCVIEIRNAQGDLRAITNPIYMS